MCIRFVRYDRETLSILYATNARGYIDMAIFFFLLDDKISKFISRENWTIIWFISSRLFAVL